MSADNSTFAALSADNGAVASLSADNGAIVLMSTLADNGAITLMSVSADNGEIVPMSSSTIMPMSMSADNGAVDKSDDKLLELLVRNQMKSGKVTPPAITMMGETFKVRMQIYKEFPPATRSMQVLAMMPICGTGIEVLKH